MEKMYNQITDKLENKLETLLLTKIDENIRVIKLWIYIKKKNSVIV